MVWDSGHKQIGYSSEWLEYENRNNLDHYIKKYKEHTVKKISELRISEEGQEGIQAFLEKRKTKWSD